MSSDQLILRGQLCARCFSGFHASRLLSTRARGGSESVCTTRERLIRSPDATGLPRSPTACHRRSTGSLVQRVIDDSSLCHGGRCTSTGRYRAWKQRHGEPLPPLHTVVTRRFSRHGREVAPLSPVSTCSLRFRDRASTTKEGLNRPIQSARVAPLCHLIASQLHWPSTA